MKYHVHRRRSLARSAHRVLRAIVVPHKDNDYRPHILRLKGLVVLLAAIVILQTGYNVVHTGSVLGRTTEISSQDLLAQTNLERTKNGEQPLRQNARLQEAAQLKANDMFEHQYWAHTSPQGIEPWKWFSDAQYSYSNAGENLAKGFTSSAGVVTAWMNSTEHRANILDVNYSDAGFAIKQGMLNGESVTLVVALYGAPKATTVATARQTVLAATDGQLSFVSRVGIGVQSMTPALVGSIALLLIVAALAVLAHSYRKSLPYSWRKGFARHHGLYKAVGMMSLVLVLIALYGSGQI